MLRVVRAPWYARVFLFMLVVMIAGTAHGQTTAFTYQGQLSDAGALANGSYDVRFALFDSAAGGAQIGANQTVPAVPVSGGVFTVQLDFGINAFPGANRFVEIAVKPVGAGSFTTLAPRQQISSAPYAIRTLSAATAATADALSSACVGCVQSAQINSVAGSKVSGTIPAASVPSGSGNYVQNTTTQQASSNFNISGNGVVGGNLTVAGTLNANVSGNFIQNGTAPQAAANFNVGGNGTIGGLLSAGRVGIGTSSPAAKFSVNGAGAFNAPGASRFDLFNTAANTGYLQHVTDSGLWQIASTAGASRMVIDPTGNVGVGTAVPQTKLSVQTATSNYGFTHTDGLVTLGSYIGIGSGQIGTRSDHPLSFFTNDSAPRMTIDRFGNVGIGTLGGTSDVRVFVDGGPAWTSAGWRGSLAFNNVSAIGWAPNAAGQQFGLGQTDGGLYFFRTGSSFGDTSSPANYDMVITDSGHVGIGTPNPSSGRLQVDGGSANSAVYGTTGGSNVPAIYGGSSGLNGTGVIGEANNGQFAYGVWGKSTNGYGVYGRSTNGGGVFGESDTGIGVYAKGGLDGYALSAEGVVDVAGKLRVTGNVFVYGAVNVEGKLFATEVHEVSDRNVKANFSDVEPQAILLKLASLPIQTWNFKSQPETERHLGPMAQDFRAVFNLGQDDKHIALLDADGVALAAIQGLYQIVQEKDEQLEQLQLRVQQLERQVQPN